MFILLQVYLIEGADLDEDDADCCLDAIATASSEVELEQFLDSYKLRYRAACQAFDAWDDLREEWGEQHDYRHAEIAAKHGVYGSLVAGTKFRIVPCLSQVQSCLSEASHDRCLPSQ